MQLQARVLLSIAVIWLILAEAAARPSSQQSPDQQPLRREARENTGFYTSHQDAGISKYNKNVDSLRPTSSDRDNLEGNFPWQEYVNVNNESESTTEYALPSADNILIHKIAIASQQEDYNDKYSSTEYNIIPTKIPENVTEEASESHHMGNSMSSSSTDHTTYFSEQDHTFPIDADVTPFESQNDNNSSLPSLGNNTAQTEFKSEKEIFHLRTFGKEFSDFQKEFSEIPKNDNSDFKESNSFNINDSTLSFIQEQNTEPVADLVVTNSLPKSHQKSDQEPATSAEVYYTNHRLQNADSDKNYYEAKEPTVHAQNPIENLNYEGYDNYNTDQREMISPPTPVGYYNYDSSRNTHMYNSVPNSVYNQNNYFQYSPVTQRTVDSPANQNYRRQDGEKHDETQYLRNFRTSRSFFLTPNFYKGTPEKYISSAQSPYTGRSQASSFNVNPNSPTPLIQAPYTVTYRIYNTNIFEPSGVGDNQTPGDSNTRQLLSWPFADYFPIVINDPFLAAYNTFFNVIEYGPAADICRRLNSQKDTVSRSTQNTGSYQMQQAGTNALPSVYAPAALPNVHHVASAASYSTVPSPPELSDVATKTLDDGQPTEIIMSSNDTTGNVTIVTKLILRKGGVSIAGPGGIATAGSGGLAIVGPGGVAYTSPNGMAIVGPGGKVVGLPSGGEIIFDQQDLDTNGEVAQKYLTKIPPGGRVVAEGPTVYYHPPQLLDMQYGSWNPPALLIPIQKELVSPYDYNVFLPLRHQTSVSYQQHVMLPSTLRITANSTHGYGANKHSSSYLSQNSSSTKAELSNIFNTSVANGTSQTNVSNLVFRKENQVLRVTEEQQNETDQGETRDREKNKHSHIAMVASAALELQSKLRSALLPQQFSQYQTTSVTIPSLPDVPNDRKDDIDALKTVQQGVTTLTSRSEELTAGKLYTRAKITVETPASEREAASLVVFEPSNYENNEDNTTTLILAPRAKSVAGENGIALATPISNAVVSRGQRVDIQFLPDAVAVAGPGGIADAHSDLFVTYVE